MLKNLAKELGLELTKEMTDEEVAELIKSKSAEKDEHINALETEKTELSNSNEELTKAVEEHKTSEAKLEKELSDSRTEVATYKGKLEQVTEMYKEQFSKGPEEQDEKPKDEKELGDDVLQKILDIK